MKKWIIGGVLVVIIGAIAIKIAAGLFFVVVGLACAGGFVFFAKWYYAKNRGK